MFPKLVQRHRLTLGLALAIAVLLIAANRSQIRGEKGRPIERPHLEYLWTFRSFDGVNPPRQGTVFCVVLDPSIPGERRLIVGNEALLSPAGIQKIVSGLEKELSNNVLYRDAAPPREIGFHRLDINNDGVDEVLLTGAGGVGGTSYLMVFQIRDDKVTKLFDDTSRFGFQIIDREGQGRYEIANPGFDWIPGPDDVMEEHHFTIYRLGDNGYEKHDVLEPAEMRTILSQLSSRSGFPLDKHRKTGVVRVYEREERN